MVEKAPEASMFKKLKVKLFSLFLKSNLTPYFKREYIGDLWLTPYDEHRWK
jgi:hypothetical protein